jgi:hypothetical protein
LGRGGEQGRLPLIARRTFTDLLYLLTAVALAPIVFGLLLFGWLAALLLAITADLAFADSERPALSGDGRWIAFDSTAQLLPGTHEPHWQVVYLRRSG